MRRSAPAPRGRGRTRVWWAVAAVAPLAGVVVWLGWFSPWFSVEQVRVEVSGEAPESAGEFPVSEVEAVIEIPPGTPMLRAPTDQITARVAALPQVKSVRVERQWPRTLVIDVQRRTPVAAVPGAGGVDLVDLEGMVVVTVPRAPSDLPFVDASGAGVPAALAVAAQLPGWLRELTEEVRATTRNDVTLALRNGAEVIWGNAERDALKAQVLQALLPGDWSWYDVSAPEVPVTSEGRVEAVDDTTAS